MQVQSPSGNAELRAQIEMERRWRNEEEEEQRQLDKPDSVVTGSSVRVLVSLLPNGYRKIVRDLCTTNNRIIYLLCKKRGIFL